MTKDYSTVQKKAAFGYVPSFNNAETGSFIGGNPYVSDDFEYPVEEDGTPLVFFAQIDLSLVSEDIKKYMNLPQYGFLQFYHSDENLYGMNFDNILDSVTKIIYLDEARDEESFIQFEAETVRATDDAISPLIDPDSRVYLTGFHIEMLPYPDSTEAPCEVYKTGVYDYHSYYKESGEKQFCLWLGGYPHFEQGDFRDEILNFPKEGLAHIIGSRSIDEITLWGNTGVGSFWIPQSNIDDRTFDNDFLYWDCS